MAQVLVTEANLTGIADAIREKNGSSASYKPGEMAAAISAIETGGQTFTVSGNAAYGCALAQLLNAGLKLDTSKATDFGYMFQYCIRPITSIDLSSFDTSSADSMERMFQGCSALTSLDVSHFDTSNVTAFQYMFSNCSSLTSLDVSGFNVGYAYSLAYMFSGCKSLTSLDVSGFAPEEMYNCTSMFSNCSGLTSLDLASFATQETTTMGSMFSGCSSLKSVRLGPNVTQLLGSGNFNGCKALTSITLASETLVTASSTTVLWAASDMYRPDAFKAGTFKIFVPAGLVDSYKSASYWSTYASCFAAIA